MQIGLIGCGNIGQFLLEMVNEKNKLPGFRIKAVLDERAHASQRVKELARQFDCEAYTNFAEFVLADIDLVVEAANIKTVQQYFPSILKKGKDALLISIGALADQHFYLELKEIARANGSKIYLPSGAIGGLDILKAASSLDQIDSVTLTTRKPAASLIGKQVDEQTVVYSGSAAQAIERFPKNINVSIILGLAGIGMERTTVNIIADPQIDKNIHQVEVVGQFGQLSLSVENEPMPGNPKTSFLAALSILSVLNEIASEVQIS